MKIKQTKVNILKQYRVMKKIECKMLKLKIKNLYVGFKILTVE
jgi:hypothetical protein